MAVLDVEQFEAWSQAHKPIDLEDKLEQQFQHWAEHCDEDGISSSRIVPMYPGPEPLR